MKVTLYTREDSAECVRVWDILRQLAAREGLDLQEAPSPQGAPAPCVRLEAPGSPFYRAEGLTEAQFLAYLAEARPNAESNNSAIRNPQSVLSRAGASPTADHEAAHPVRSFLWRHRVGGIIASLSVFVGLGWLAPLTPSWGWGNGFYHAVKGAYRLVCDQVPERSAQLGGLPVCLCWRCSAMYGGSLLFGILYAVGRDRNIGWLDWLRRPVSLIVMLLYGLPLILDGATHALGWRPGVADAHSADFWLSWKAFSADWWLRIATALLATVGAVKFLCPRLDKLGFEYERLHGLRLRSKSAFVPTNSRPSTRQPAPPGG